MTNAEAADRIDRLRREIRRHDHLYYVKGHPEIADAAYDRLLLEFDTERAGGFGGSAQLADPLALGVVAVLGHHAAGTDRPDSSDDNVIFALLLADQEFSGD